MEGPVGMCFISEEKKWGEFVQRVINDDEVDHYILHEMDCSNFSKSKSMQDKLRKII